MDYLNKLPRYKPPSSLTLLQVSAGLLSVSALHLILNIVGLLNSFVLCLFLSSLALLAFVSVTESKPFVTRQYKAHKPMLDSIQKVFTSKEKTSRRASFDKACSYLPLSVRSFMEEWSVFDMLCMTYVIRQYVINCIAVMSAFLYTSDPIEAQIMLRQM